VSLPVQASLEAVIAGGVALWDVSHLLARHERARYELRPLSGIRRVYVHHSGALGAPGFAGARASARYSVSEEGWPGPAYHYWIPAETLRDPYGRLVVLRLNEDRTRCWHTGGEANGHGLGVVLQGDTTAEPLTASHEEGLEALLPWLRRRHELGAPWLSWHAEAGAYGGKTKETCPGKHAEAWLTAYRSRAG
jgi:hypothetical protein